MKTGSIIVVDPLDVLLQEIGGQQDSIFYHAVVDLAASVVGQPGTGGTFQVEAGTVMVVTEIWAQVVDKGGAAYDEVPGPVSPAHLHLEADLADTRGWSDLNHPVSLSARWELAFSGRRPASLHHEPVPLGIFGAEGVWRPRRPFLIPGNAVGTFKVTPALAPAVALQVEFTVGGIACYGGKLPKLEG